MSTENQPYVASHELVDDLKMNVSVLKPHQEQQFMGAVESFQQILLDSYGEFIPEETLIQNQNLKRRIVVSNSTQLLVAKKEWNPELQGPKDVAGIKTRGFFHPLGNILFLTHPRYTGYQHWNNTSQEVRDSWVEATGSVKDAKREFGALFFGNNILHEIVHAYEGRDHILGFSEGGATYYQEELCKASELFSFTGSNQGYESLGRLYKAFVDTYGDKMHRIYFGGKIDPLEKEAIHKVFVDLLHHIIAFGGKE